MPPVNTPASNSPIAAIDASNTQTSPAPRSLTPFSYLSSPVPDLASTLHTHAADAADDANASFLRDSLLSLDQPSQPDGEMDSGNDSGRNAQEQTSRQDETQSTAPPSRLGNQEDMSRRERLQRVLARLNRWHEPSASSTSAYSNRTPSPNRQSLYDWAPGSDENLQADGEVEAILNELRRQRSNLSSQDSQDSSAPWSHHPLPQQHAMMQRLRETRQAADQRAAMWLSPSAGESNDTVERRERLRERERRRRDNELVGPRNRALLLQRRTPDQRTVMWLPPSSSEMNVLRERQDPEPERARRLDNEMTNLRNRAALQRARRESSGSPSATQNMLRYVMERERSGMSEEEERARGSGWFRPSLTGTADDRETPTTVGRENWTLPPPATDTRQRERQGEVENFRRGYLADNPPPRLLNSIRAGAPGGELSRTSRPTFLVETLSYLNDVRKYTLYGECYAVAIGNGMGKLEAFDQSHHDFVMQLDKLPPLPYSSWLQPGTVFEGFQRGAGLVPQRQPSASNVVEQINPHFQSSMTHDQPTGSTTQGSQHTASTAPFEQFLSPPRSSASKPQLATSGGWPVRATIHAVDAEKMIVQGTMEAYNVPQHPSNVPEFVGPGLPPTAGKKSAPITTYLEGQIVDLRTHTFLTPGSEDPPKQANQSRTRSSDSSIFSDTITYPPTSASTDASNWRQIPPFSHLGSDDEMAGLLLSKDRLARLNAEYIFMRWKERCFIHHRHEGECSDSDPGHRVSDLDRGHGLTITGFYYISLRRSDGKVEGMYYDPSSVPHQRLSLEAWRAGGWPAVEFR